MTKVLKAAGEEIDWLLYAVGACGGTTETARKLGVSRRTIINWLENGAGHAAFGKIVKLAAIAQVDPSLFRDGPPTRGQLAHYKGLARRGRAA